MSKFVGVAYWDGTLPEEWEQVVFDTLGSVEGLQISKEKTGLALSFEDGRINLLSASGRTQGIVPASAAAGVLVLCLVALRRALGTFDVVDDAKASIPATVRQANPLYAGDWQRITQIAAGLGLAANGQFVARHAGILNVLI